MWSWEPITFRKMTTLANDTFICRLECRNSNRLICRVNFFSNYTSFAPKHLKNGSLEIIFGLDLDLDWVQSSRPLLTPSSEKRSKAAKTLPRWVGSKMYCYKWNDSMKLRCCVSEKHTFVYLEKANASQQKCQANVEVTAMQRVDFASMLPKRRPPFCSSWYVFFSDFI